MVLDRVKFKQLNAELENLDERETATEKAEEEIEAGELQETQKEKRILELEEHLRSTRWYRKDVAQELATKEVLIKGEEGVIKELLDPAITPARVRELCRDAVMIRKFKDSSGATKEVEVPAWPIPFGSTLPTYLSQYAEQYVGALHDPRFPRCDVSIRPSNRLKQFWFLSRALAGALFGVSTRTAVNLVGSLRPEESFLWSHGARPVRKRRKQTGHR